MTETTSRNTGAECAEIELQRLVDKRARFFEREEANAAAEEQRRVEEANRLRRGRDYRAEWLEYHRHRADLFAELADEHREAMLSILDGAAS